MKNTKSRGRSNVRWVINRSMDVLLPVSDASGSARNTLPPHIIKSERPAPSIEGTRQSKSQQTLDRIGSPSQLKAEVSPLCPVRVFDFIVNVISQKDDREYFTAGL